MKLRPGMYVKYMSYKCKVLSVYSDYVELQVITGNENKVVSAPYDKISYIVETNNSSATKGCRLMYD